MPITWFFWSSIKMTKCSRSVSAGTPAAQCEHWQNSLCETRSWASSLLAPGSHDKWGCWLVSSSSSFLQPKGPFVAVVSCVYPTGQCPHHLCRSDRRVEQGCFPASTRALWLLLLVLPPIDQFRNRLCGSTTTLFAVIGNRAASSKYTLFGLSVGCKPPRCLESAVPEEQIMYTEFVH